MNRGKRALSRFVLDETPPRVLGFLRALGTVKPLRALLAAHGYREDDHLEGWKLLFRASGSTFRAVSLAGDNGAQRDTDPVGDAIRELVEWEPGAFRRARAALNRLHPAQAEFVFRQLDALPPTEVLLGVAEFLDRLDELERGAERKSTRKEDHAALATLATRGITAAQRTWLRGLLERTQSSPVEDEPQLTPSQQQRDADLAALRAWYNDWVETARTVVKRRDHLIRLGLAKRRTRRASEPKAPPKVIDPTASIDVDSRELR